MAVLISYLWFISHLQDPFAWDLRVEVEVDCRQGMMDFFKEDGNVLKLDVVMFAQPINVFKALNCALKPYMGFLNTN